MSISDTTTTEANVCHQLGCSSYNQLAVMVNYGAVLLLGVVLLMAWSTTGVPMSPGYGGYKTATPSPFYTTTTYAATGCYTLRAPEYCTTTFDASSYYTKALKYNSAPTYITKESEYYTEAP